MPAAIENNVKRFLDNNKDEELKEMDQKRLLSELPSMLRGQIVAHTYGVIVKVVRFFDNKPQDFLMEILPLFNTMKVYKKDVLYNQGD